MNLSAQQYFASTGGVIPLHVDQPTTRCVLGGVIVQGVNIVTRSCTSATSAGFQVSGNNYADAQQLIVAVQQLLDAAQMFYNHARDTLGCERRSARLVMTKVQLATASFAARRLPSSIADQILEIGTALSLNKSQLAEVLGISRPTLYEWQAGQQPHDSNTERLEKVVQLMACATISAANPLNARFVRKVLAPAKNSLLELLTAKSLDERKIEVALTEAREMSRLDALQRNRRTAELARLGYEDSTDDERRDRLATNVAQMEWPK